MEHSQSRAEAFVSYLEGLRAREDRAALAALRRGLGKPPGAAAETYPYVVPWIEGLSREEQDAYFLLAALFASHPDPGGEGGMGRVLRAVYEASDRTERTESIEKRFVGLLNAHPEELPIHLRHAVALARSRPVPIPIDWLRLLRDLRGFGHPDRYVQRRWAVEFWGQGGGGPRQEPEAVGTPSEVVEQALSPSA